MSTHLFRHLGDKVIDHEPCAECVRCATCRREWCPTFVDKCPDHWPYAEAMRYDIRALLESDAVVVLPRWDEGVGTRVEVSIALAVGIPVYEYPHLTLVELYSADAGRDALRELLMGSPA